VSFDDLFRPDEVETRAHKIERAGSDDGLLGWLAQPIGADEVKAAGGETSDGQSHFVASTGVVDRMGDIVEQESWRLANFRSNPVILHEHYQPVVGRGSARVVDGDGGKRLVLSVTWDDGDHNPIGRMVAEQHRRGFRHAVSVGFRPGKAISRKDLPEDDPRRVADKDVPSWRAGHLFRFNELLEVSSVAIPANPEALQLASFAREPEDPTEQIRRVLAETTPKAVRDAVLDLVRRDAEVRRAIGAALLSEPVDPAHNNAGISWLNRG
jgi:phage head maturation protease